MEDTPGANPAPPLPLSPLPQVAKRVRVLAYIFLFSNALSLLGGSVISLVYAIFLYFGVIKGLRRGNAKAMRWFSRCSCFLAISGIILVILFLALLNPLLSCACNPVCVSTLWLGRNTTEDGPRNLWDGVTTNATSSVGRLLLETASPYYFPPPHSNHSSSELTLSDIQVFAGMVCNYKALLYVGTALVFAWAVLHALAWYYARKLLELPWFLAQRLAYLQSRFPNPLPPVILYQEDNLVGDFWEQLQTHVLTPLNQAFTRLRGGAVYTPVGTVEQQQQQQVAPPLQYPAPPPSQHLPPQQYFTQPPPPMQ